MLNLISRALELVNVAQVDENVAGSYANTAVPPSVSILSVTPMLVNEVEVAELVTPIVKVARSE